MRSDLPLSSITWDMVRCQARTQDFSRKWKSLTIDPRREGITESHCFMVGKPPKFSLQSSRKGLATNEGFASVSKVGEVQIVPDWMVLTGE